QSGGNAALVRINLDWRDAANAVIGHSSTLATKQVLKNLDYSPFEDIEFPAPSLNYDHFTVGAISYSRSVQSPYHLDSATIACPAGSPADEVCGSVTNNGTLTAQDVSAILTYTDGTGTAVGQDAWPVDSDLS